MSTARSGGSRGSGKERPWLRRVRRRVHGRDIAGAGDIHEPQRQQRPRQLGKLRAGHRQVRFGIDVEGADDEHGSMRSAASAAARASQDNVNIKSRKKKGQRKKSKKRPGDGDEGR